MTTSIPTRNADPANNDPATFGTNGISTVTTIDDSFADGPQDAASMAATRIDRSKLTRDGVRLTAGLDELQDEVSTIEEIRKARRAKRKDYIGREFIVTWYGPVHFFGVTYDVNDVIVFSPHILQSGSAIGRIDAALKNGMII